MVKVEINGWTWWQWHARVTTRRAFGFRRLDQRDTLSALFIGFFCPAYMLRLHTCSHHTHETCRSRPSSNVTPCVAGTAPAPAQAPAPYRNRTTCIQYTDRPFTWPMLMLTQLGPARPETCACKKSYYLGCTCCICENTDIGIAY